MCFRSEPDLVMLGTACLVQTVALLFP
jgi:hypothetical protein